MTLAVQPTTTWYLLLSAVLFAIGTFGVLVRRNPLVMFMCIELMLNAVNLTMVSAGRALNDINGQVAVFFILVVAAAEVVVGLAIIVAIFGIFAILVLEFGNFKSTLIVLTVVPLGVFGGLMAWTIWQGLQKRADALGGEMEQELEIRATPIRRAVFWLVAGLIILIISSRILVWGAVEIAHGFGVSDLIIGLTIVAVGTSLPELASSVIATRKGEHDIALGNVLGSNLFNTLAVVGIAGVIHPLAVGPELFNRDMLVMTALTLSLFVIGYGFRGPGRINRVEGSVLLACYVGYTTYLVSTAFGQ